MSPDYDGRERRRPGISGMPWYVQAISTLGFPIVVALVLLGMFIGYIPSPISETRDYMKYHVMTDAERTAIIRAMCIHQAQAFNKSTDDCLNGRSYGRGSDH